MKEAEKYRLALRQQVRFWIVRFWIILFFLDLMTAALLVVGKASWWTWKFPLLEGTAMNFLGN